MNVMCATLLSALLAMGCQTTPLPPHPPPNPTAAFAQLVIGQSERPMYTVLDDGSDRRDLGQAGSTPSWTPDGRIVFVSRDRTAIKIMDADGRNSTVIKDGLTRAAKPHQVGGLISYTTVATGGRDEVWVMRRDGSGARKVTDGMAPFLAPDASWLTFVRQTPNPSRSEGFDREVYRVNVNGSDERQLTFYGRNPDHPDGNAAAISPDGQVIAIFWGHEDSGTRGWQRRDVALMPSGGGVPRVLVASVTPTPRFPNDYPPAPAVLTADNPRWFGRSIVYDGGRPDAQSGTYIIPANGSGAARRIAEFQGAGNVPMRKTP